MKKEILISAIFLIIFSTLTCAVQINLEEEYKASQTVIVELTGNIIEPIQISQVNLKRINVNVPFEYDVKKIGSKYFIWFITPKNSGNYTLIIKDIVSNEAGQIVKKDYLENFSVSQNVSDYYIQPGFISAESDFEIEIYSNVLTDEKISIDLPFTRDVTLKSGPNRIKFEIDEFSQSYEGPINVGNYKFISYIVVEENVSDDEPDVEFRLKEIKVRPSKIDSTILSNGSFRHKIIVENTGSKKIDFAYFDFNGSKLMIEPDGVFSIDVNQTKEFNLSFYKNQKQNIDGEIYLNYDEGYRAKISLRVNITNDTKQVVTSYQDDKNNLLKCSEIPGTVCLSSQVCSSQSANSLEGACCLGTCISLDNEDESGYGWIGYLIAGLVIAIGIYFYFRYNKAAQVNPKSSFLEAFNKKD